MPAPTAAFQLEFLAKVERLLATGKKPIASFFISHYATTFASAACDARGKEGSFEHRLGQTPVISINRRRHGSAIRLAENA